MDNQPDNHSHSLSPEKGTMSAREYDALKTTSQTSPPPFKKIGQARKITSLVLITLFALSFLFPAFSLFSLPLIVFAGFAVRDIFGDARISTKKTSPASLFFIIIGGFAVTAVIGCIAIIALFALLLSATGGKGS